jgi:hypothetical protein
LCFYKRKRMMSLLENKRLFALGSGLWTGGALSPMPPLINDGHWESRGLGVHRNTVYALHPAPPHLSDCMHSVTQDWKVRHPLCWALFGSLCSGYAGDSECRNDEPAMRYRRSRHLRASQRSIVDYGDHGRQVEAMRDVSVFIRRTFRASYLSWSVTQ